MASSDAAAAHRAREEAIDRAKKAEIALTRAQEAEAARKASQVTRDLALANDLGCMKTRAENAEAEIADLEGRNLDLRQQLRHLTGQINAVDRATVVALQESVAAMSSNLRLTGERADKAEAEMALAVRLVREWSALYGGTVYEVVGTRELLARHVG